MEKLIKQSLLSGILVGIGVIINIISMNNYIGAMLFSFALIAIIKCNLKLYTGKIGYYTTSKTFSLFMILIYNFVGVILPTIGLVLCNSKLYKNFLNTSNKKFSNGFIELFLYSLMCGILIFISVYTKDLMITIFCIMIFILSGYEHCVVDFPFLVINFSLVNMFKFTVIIAGNSIGSIVTRYLLE